MVSVAMVLVIVLCTIVGFIYIRKKRDDDELLTHKGFIEMLPSLVSTLGVLGTFAGVHSGTAPIV